MKTSDKGTHLEIELETHEGQQTFISGNKNGNDHRQWTRHPETAEMAQVLQQNQNHHQIYVKCGDVYSQVK